MTREKMKKEKVLVVRIFNSAKWNDAISPSIVIFQRDI